MLAGIGVVGYFAALGDQGPTGTLFRWAYYHVPFFDIMREPQKFLMLTVLAYAYFFGYGVERLLGGWSPLRAAGALALAMVLPLSYTATIFDGLSGQISLVNTPASWLAANQLMGPGEGEVLFLPWHLYLSFPFTGRVIANPAPSSFSRPVIYGDNVEAGGESTESTSPRSAYIEGLLSRGPDITNFGSQLVPLGVQYVLLSETVDWSSYSWLARQPDLRLVYQEGGLEVWRNTAYHGIASGGRAVTRLSSVAYSVAPGPTATVSVDVPYEKGWRFDGRPVGESRQGTVVFSAGRTGGRLVFGPWPDVRLSYWVSGLTAAVLALSLLLARRPETRPERDAPASVQVVG
jgi:hypothetical protein